MKKYLFIFALLFPFVAFGDESRPKREYVETVTTAKLTDAAINTACGANPWDTETPACAYFTHKVLGYHQAELTIKFVKGGTATTVWMVCEGSVTGLKPWGKYQGGDASFLPAFINMTDKLYRWDVSAWGAATDVWRASVKMNDRSLRCRFWADGATADDKVSVWITLGAP